MTKHYYSSVGELITELIRKINQTQFTIQRVVNEMESVLARMDRGEPHPDTEISNLAMAIIRKISYTPWTIEDIMSTLIDIWNGKTIEDINDISPDILGVLARLRREVQLRQAAIRIGESIKDVGGDRLADYLLLIKSIGIGE